MKSVLDWIINKKDSLTTWLGFFFALVVVLQPLFSAGEPPSISTIATAVFGFVIAWFTGKIPNPLK